MQAGALEEITKLARKWPFLYFFGIFFRIFGAKPEIGDFVFFRIFSYFQA